MCLGDLAGINHAFPILINPARVPGCSAMYRDRLGAMQRSLWRCSQNSLITGSVLFQNTAPDAIFSQTASRTMQELLHEAQLWDTQRHFLHIKVLIFTSGLCSWPHLFSQSCTFVLQTFCQDKHTVMPLTELDQTTGLAESNSCNNSQPKLSFVITSTTFFEPLATPHHPG